MNTQTFAWGLFALLLWIVAGSAADAQSVDTRCIAQGGFALCTDPVPVASPPGAATDKDMWQYNVCDVDASSPFRDQAWCTARGGCGKPVFDADIGGTAVKFEQIVNNACQVAVSDSGWGQTLPYNLFCWTGPPLAQSGLLVRDFRILNFTGLKPGSTGCNVPWTDVVYAGRWRAVACPVGYDTRAKANGDLECWRFPPECSVKSIVANPINLLDGCKLQRELDYRSRTPGGLEVERFYNSAGHFRLDGAATSSADVWRTTWDRRVLVPPPTAGVLAYAQRADGSVQVFLPDGRELYNQQGGAAALLERLADGGSVATGWRLTTADRDVELYDAAGRLRSVSLRAGATHVLAYDAGGRLATVSDVHGAVLTFTYTASGQPGGFVAPGNRSHVYGYDARGRLTTVTYPDGAVRTYHYENVSFPHALTGITDENGQRFATWEYDSTGRATASRHAAGADAVTLSFGSFSAAANEGVTVVTDALGTTRSYYYQIAGGVRRVKRVDQPCADCAGGTYVYDANGNPVSYRDFNGNRTSYVYDSARNLEISRTEAAGTSLARTVETQWHPVYRLPTRITAPSGAAGVAEVADHAYDAQGNLVRKTVTAGARIRQWTSTYDTLGRVLSKDGPRTDVADVTAYTYYAANDPCIACRGNLKTVTNAMGDVTSYSAYDFDGHALMIVDPNGAATALAYDVRGRLVSRSVGGETTRYTYDAVGQLTRVTQPDGSYLAYAYDGAHRLTQIADGLGNRIIYTLDALGNRLQERVVDPSGALSRSRSRTIDALNRVATERGAQGETTTYAYDGNGNPITVTDPLGRVTSNTYDVLNRLTQVVDASLGVTRYAYDLAGNLVQVTDPGSLPTSWSFDGLNDPVQQVSPDTGVATSTFDAAGNLQSRTNARGITATYTYDPLQRVTQIVYTKAGTSSLTHRFEYDGGAGGAPNAKGRLTKVSDAAAVTSWTHNSQGRVATKTQTIGALVQTVRYDYNSAGQLAQITTPSGQTISYTYLNNRIVSIGANGTSILGGAYHTPFGPVGAWQWGNGAQTFRIYDADGRLASWEFTAGGTSLLKKTVSYDAASRITAIDNPNNAALSQRYTSYDALDRLLRAETADPPTHVQQFTYDAKGNRQSSMIDGATTSYSYASGSNRLSALSGATIRSYAYNLIGNANAVGPLTYTYDRAERLTQVSSGSTLIATYDVNALGQRLRKTVGSTVTHFVYDEQGHLLGEYDGTGTIIQETVWLDDLPVAILRPVAGTTPLTINRFYVHADHLGSPRAVTRTSDNGLRWTWNNVDPFGANAENPSPAGYPTFNYALRFPGQYFDAETGNHYNHFRDYDPVTGRYIESDPVGLKGGTNIYMYVSANPLRGIDPKGLFAIYGNWCGPNWTGGFRKPWDQIAIQEMPGVKPPIDALDSCCQVHDVCHGSCRSFFPCNPSNRGNCYKTCDRTLANCASKSGARGPTEWGIELYMNNSNPDPESNDSRCPGNCDLTKDNLDAQRTGSGR